MSALALPRQAKANRGILYVDEVNLLDDGLVDVVLDSAASGVNTVEREGISIAHPAKVSHWPVILSQQQHAAYPNGWSAGVDTSEACQWCVYSHAERCVTWCHCSSS